MNLQEIESDSRVYERFLEKTTVSESSCWEVGGARNGAGYGCIYIPTSPRRSQTEFTHRYSYELFKGKIPKGLVVDHLCRNKCCANPEHLEAVTPAENLRRGDYAKAMREIHEKRTPEERKARAKHANTFNVEKLLKRTHCRKGHEVTPETTHTHPNGTRRCKICTSLTPSKIAVVARGNKTKEKRLAKTHCVNGHTWNAENTFKEKDGSTKCRICVYERNRKRYRDKRNLKAGI